MEIPTCNPAELLINGEIKKAKLCLCFPGKQSCDHQKPHTKEMENLLLKYTVRNVEKCSLVLVLVSHFVVRPPISEELIGASGSH